MRFGRFFHFRLRAAFTVLTLACFVVVANAEDAASRLQKIAAANSLELPGKTPFHLKMSFQLYDLDGKASDIGIVEKWWAAPGQSRTTIIASALKQTEPIVFDDSLRIDPRERYLLDELLRSETRPFPAASPKSFVKLDEKNRKFDKTTLRCLNLPPLDNSFDAEAKGASALKTYCTDPTTDTLLLEFTDQDGHTITRRDLGVFHETSIPLEIQVSYAGRLAIVGKVVQIKLFDPKTSEVRLSLPLNMTGSIPQHLVSAKLEKGVDPEIPFAVLNSRAAGVVVVSGLVTKLGTIQDIFVIASSNSVLARAEIEAFSRYKFEPFLLDGEPIERRVTSELVLAFGNNGGDVRLEGVPHSLPSP